MSQWIFWILLHWLLNSQNSASSYLLRTFILQELTFENFVLRITYTLHIPHRPYTPYTPYSTYSMFHIHFCQESWYLPPLHARHTHLPPFLPWQLHLHRRLKISGPIENCGKKKKRQVLPLVENFKSPRHIQNTMRIDDGFSLYILRIYFPLYMLHVYIVEFICLFECCLNFNCIFTKELPFASACQMSYDYYMYVIVNFIWLLHVRKTNYILQVHVKFRTKYYVCMRV